MKWTIAQASAAALTMLLWSGCQNTVNTVENTEKHQNFTEISDTRFQTDSFLKNRLQLTRVNAAPNAGGLLEVQVSALNARTGFWSEMWSGMTGENPYPVSYRFSWFDENGMEVDSPMNAWRRVQIIPGQTVYFKAVAPSPQCRDFILDVRETD